MTPKEVLAMCRQKDVKAVDLRFTDFFGSWHHFTIPVNRLNEDAFDDGFGFNGSHMRGWQPIHESDLVAVPEPRTAFLDPFAEWPTLAICCGIQDPLTKEDYSKDPRNIAIKATHYLTTTGIADIACFGPEAEFYVFDRADFANDLQSGFFEVETFGGITATGNHHPSNIARPSHRIPTDNMMDLRNEMMQKLQDCGVDVEGHHRELGGPGQGEVGLRFLDLVTMADHLMVYKYVVKKVAAQHGKTATFMPKPLWNNNGNGMHTHLSLWKDEQPVFAGNSYAGLSETAIHAIAGLQKHAPALMAFTNPTTNSYKRFVPGFEAPINLAYGHRNRSAAFRVPMYSSNPKSKRIEFRCPDPSCNPYFAFAAILMAMIDGIQRKMSPGDPTEVDVYDLSTVDTKHRLPSSLEISLAALQADHDFLLRGEVFTDDVIETWIDLKRRNELEPLQQLPHPYEFCLYFEV